MTMTANDILYYGRAKETEDHCTSVDELFNITNKEIFDKCNQ